MIFEDNYTIREKINSIKHNAKQEEKDFYYFYIENCCVSGDNSNSAQTVLRESNIFDENVKQKLIDKICDFPAEAASILKIIHSHSWRDFVYHAEFAEQNQATTELPLYVIGEHKNIIHEKQIYQLIDSALKGYQSSYTVISLFGYMLPQDVRNNIILKHKFDYRTLHYYVTDGYNFLTCEELNIIIDFIIGCDPNVFDYNIHRAPATLLENFLESTGHPRNEQVQTEYPLLMTIEDIEATRLKVWKFLHSTYKIEKLRAFVLKIHSDLLYNETQWLYNIIGKEWFNDTKSTYNPFTDAVSVFSIVMDYEWFDKLTNKLMKKRYQQDIKRSVQIYKNYPIDLKDKLDSYLVAQKIINS